MYYVGTCIYSDNCQQALLSLLPRLVLLMTDRLPAYVYQCNKVVYCTKSAYPSSPLPQPRPHGGRASREVVHCILRMHEFYSIVLNRF